MLRLIGARSPAFVDTALLFAIAEGCALTVAALLGLGADPDAAAPNGLNPLIVASERGATAIVRLLVAAAADVDRVSGTQLTALAVAARNGHPDVVEVLLGAGPACGTVDHALVFAGKMGHADVVALLVAGGRRLFPDFGGTALRLAVTDGAQVPVPVPLPPTVWGRGAVLCRGDRAAPTASPSGPGPGGVPEPTERARGPVHWGRGFRTWGQGFASQLSVPRGGGGAIPPHPPLGPGLHRGKKIEFFQKEIWIWLFLVHNLRTFGLQDPSPPLSLKENSAPPPPPPLFSPRRAPAECPPPQCHTTGTQCTGHAR